MYLPNPTRPIVATEDVVGLALQIGLPQTGDPANARCPMNLRAVTWPAGKRIDLVWTNPTGIQRVIIKRGQLAHSAFIQDAKTVIYDGPPIEHFIDGKKLGITLGNADGIQSPPNLEIDPPATGADLPESTYYYYTVYMTVKAEPIGAFDFGLEAKSPCQVTGLSILDFASARQSDKFRGKWFGEYFYNCWSDATKQQDRAMAIQSQRPNDRGWFQDFCLFIQGSFDLYRGHAVALEQLANLDRTPAGLVGNAVDQSSILSASVRKFKLQPELYILDLEIMRRIVQTMVFLYKEKGTCPGLVDWVKVLTQWDSTCAEFEDDLGPCNPIYLRTWDGEDRIVRVVRQASLLTIGAGFVGIPGQGLNVDEHADSLMCTSMWQQFQIKSNTSDTVILTDETAIVRKEDMLSVTAIVSLGGTTYEATMTRTGDETALLNDAEYDGYYVLFSNNVLAYVTETVSGVLSSKVKVDASSVPATGVAAAAYNYLLGATFADRDPVVVLRMHTQCPTFIYDPLMDVRLSGSLDPDIVNPHDILWAGGSLLTIPFSPGDTILTIAPGVAKFVGTSTTVAGNTLTDTTANFGFNGSNKYHYLNPNQNQTGLFRILSNTSTTLTVEPPFPGVTLEDVAIAGNSYAVLDFPKHRFYELLVRMVKKFQPVKNRIFIRFAG